MSRLFTGPSATGWKPAASRGLGDEEAAATLEAAVLSTSTLPKAVAASVT